MLLLVVAVALGCAACGEITSFCLSAGAPDGLIIQTTTAPARDRSQTDCRPDTSRVR